MSDERRFELELLSYVLLGNQYHTLVRIHDARVSRAVQLLHTEYSRHHNRRQIESDEDLVAAYRYLARNPVEANLVSDPLDWRWEAPAATPSWNSRRSHSRKIISAVFGSGSAWRERYRNYTRQ